MKVWTWLAVFLCLAAWVSGQQEENRVSYRNEVVALEKKLENKTLAAAERRQTLTALARLRQSAGNIEGAAEAWSLAAYTEQGRRDDGALFEAASCLIAMGEWEKAETAIKAILSGQDNSARLKARYLGAQLEAFRAKTGGCSALESLMAEPGYADSVSQILYLLWKVSANETYRTRLLREFPGSPEALMAVNSPGTAVTPSPTALWLLFSGREGVTVEQPRLTQAGPAQPAPQTAAQTTSPAQSAAQTSPAQANATESPSMLQVGLFSREPNAKAMEERLKAKGFAVIVSEKTVNGTKYWVVGAHPGTDYNNTLHRLKDAGFESFPVF